MMLCIFFLSLSYILDQLLMAVEKECGDVVAEGPVVFRAHYEQIKTVKQMSAVYKGMDMVDVVRTTTCRECLELLELQRLRVHIDLIDARLGIATPSHKYPSVIHFYNPFSYFAFEEDAKSRLRKMPPPFRLATKFTKECSVESAAIFQVSFAKVIKEPQFPFLASPAFGDAESAGMPTRSFCRWCKNWMG